MRGGNRSLNEDDAEFVDAVSNAVIELLENTTDHAALGDASQSFVQIDITKGSTDLVYLTVFDTGLGIPATIHARYSEIPERESASHLIENAVAGRLPHHGRGRGRGLFRLRETIDDYKGQLAILTHIPEEGFGASESLAQVEYQRGEYKYDLYCNLPFQGSVVRAAFAMPSSRGVSGEVANERQLAMTGGEGRPGQ
jgi:anti-sigma regulatory factor (Ser/Thr protein kinase)